MKVRFFYADKITHMNGMETPAKLFVLTEDGRFYSKFTDWGEHHSPLIEIFDFEGFDPESYKWDGYQSIYEIDEKLARDVKFPDQENWIDKYLLGCKDRYRYVSLEHIFFHFLGAKRMDVVTIGKDWVSFPVDEKRGNKDLEISKEGVYECLLEHIDSFDERLEIWPIDNGSIRNMPGTKTIFGRVVKQPETKKKHEYGYGTNPEFLFISKYTLENIRLFLKAKQS